MELQSVSMTRMAAGPIKVLVSVCGSGIEVVVYFAMF